MKLSHLWGNYLSDGPDPKLKRSDGDGIIALRLGVAQFLSLFATGQFENLRL